MSTGLSQLTATTATVKFNNVECGQLSNITIHENYNFRELDSCGHVYPKIFLPGVFRGQITCRSAYIDPYPIIDNLISSTSTAGLVGKNIINLEPGMIGVAGDITFQKTDELVGMIKNIFKGNSSTYNDRNSFILLFDVDVYDADGKMWMSMIDCVIDSRRTVIDTGQIVIMKELSLKYLKRVA